MPASSVAVFSTTTPKCLRSSCRSLLCQIPGRADAQSEQLWGKARADAPHAINRKFPEHFFTQGLRADIQHAAGAFLPAFGGVIGQLGQGLGWCYAHADRDIGTAQHGLLQVLTELLQGLGQTAEVGECLVDRIYLYPRNQTFDDLHDAGAHVAVEGIVGAEGGHLLPAQLLAHLKVGRAHGNVELLGFFAAADDAAVVVGQHHDRFAVQVRAEDALAAAIETVAVDQGDGRFSHAGRAGGCCGVPRPRFAARPRR